MPYVTSITDRSLTRVSDRVAPRARWVAAGLALVAAALAGCSGGSGPAVEVAPGSGGGPVTQTYTGPAPATADVQAFKINLWDNIHADNRCGTCHSVSGGQTPMFARSDDVNLAYAAANLVVDLASPKDSMMVVKVGGGHNCWLASNAACASILTTWITNWAGSTAAGGDRKIQLEPPVIRDPGTSKNFPNDQGLLYSTTVYPLVSQYCSRCHSSSRKWTSTIPRTRGSCCDCATSLTTAGRPAARTTPTRCKRQSRISRPASLRPRSIRTWSPARPRLCMKARSRRAAIATTRP
jgi:hypothetical protein